MSWHMPLSANSFVAFIELLQSWLQAITVATNGAKLFDLVHVRLDASHNDHHALNSAILLALCLYYRSFTHVSNHNFGEYVGSQVR